MSIFMPRMTLPLGFKRGSITGMLILKCIGCGGLREWKPRCTHCGDDRVELLVMQSESDDQPAFASSDSCTASNAFWLSDSLR
jgi:hypothetical protein